VRTAGTGIPERGTRTRTDPLLPGAWCLFRSRCFSGVGGSCEASAKQDGEAGFAAQGWEHVSRNTEPGEKQTREVKANTCRTRIYGFRARREPFCFVPKLSETFRFVPFRSALLRVVPGWGVAWRPGAGGGWR